MIISREHKARLWDFCYLMLVFYHAYCMYASSMLQLHYLLSWKVGEVLKYCMGITETSPS